MGCRHCKQTTDALSGIAQFAAQFRLHRATERRTRIGVHPRRDSSLLRVFELAEPTLVLAMTVIHTIFVTFPIFALPLHGNGAEPRSQWRENIPTALRMVWGLMLCISL